MGNSLKPFKQQPTSFAYQPLINPPISAEAENENLRVFSFAKMKKAMKKFRQDRVVECDDGSVLTFYKGYINDTTFAPSCTETKTPVSVIKCLQDSSQTLQEWMEEVKSLGKISHLNLVKLLGYCCEDNISFLVFEYLQKGSLDCHIFGKEKEALPWEIRVKIAIGIAQGLAFLHSKKSSPLHQELRIHNILLDEQYNAKLFYLESNYLKDESTFVGKLEYLAPECTTGGPLGMEIDVYSFGVILLELFTGSPNLNKQSLDVWNSTYFLSENNKNGEIIDPRLGSNYPVNAATHMGTLINRCTKPDKYTRPLMQEVVDTLNYIAEIM